MLKHSLTHSQKQRIIERISTYLAAYKKDVYTAYLFGSFIKDDSFSDIDLGILNRIVLEKPLNFEIGLENQLEDIIIYPVDVRILNNAPISFCQDVIRHGSVILDRDPNARADFEGKVLKQYFDFSCFRRLYLAEVINAPF
jgi:predicted nucleotidyltransferase